MTNKSGKFLSYIEGNFLSQPLNELARKEGLLDSLLLNRKALLVHVRLSCCPGHSGHKILEFRIFGVMTKKFSKVASQDFKRANFKLLRGLVRSVPQEPAFEGYGVHEYRSVFKNHHLKAQEQAITLCKWGRSSDWLNRRLLMKEKKVV